MDEMKSIFQVPVVKSFVDLHYLIEISPVYFTQLDPTHSGSKQYYSTLSTELSYRFFEKKIIVIIKTHELFTQAEWERLGNNWKEVSKKQFEDRIRIPIVRAWEQYRKYMAE